jgi:hypothetical protein
MMDSCIRFWRRLVVKRLAYSLVLLLILFLAFAARCWPLHDVFLDGQIYFADPDCYSRMTRARMVTDGRAWFIKHHDFENHPAGTTPHTTAPMDFAIAVLSKIVAAGFETTDAGRQSILRGQALDLAGALIGPILGVLTCLAVAMALPRNEAGEPWRNLAAAFLVAISPIVVHGTLLGRPDHQALLIPLLAVAIALELRLLREVSQRVAVTAGAAWGLALWVSLYEPLVLMALMWIGLALFQRGAFFERERFFGWLTTFLIFAASVLIDGWRLHPLDASMRAAFARWSMDIEEMKPVKLFSLSLWSWIGFAAILAPVALGWLSRRRLDARVALWLLLCTFGLTLWQARWGYFLALVFALTLPLQMLALQRNWLRWTLLGLGLWPILKGWDVQLFPEDPEVRRRVDLRQERIALRAIAEQQGAHTAGVFVAPWWLSPSVSYWSKQPGVAGSSHESLPGIVDTARHLPRDRRELSAAHLKATPGAVDPLRGTGTDRAGLRAHPRSTRASVLPGVSTGLRNDPPPNSPLQRDRAVKLPPGRDFFHVWRVKTQP